MIKQSSYIYLSNLRFRAYHGVLPQERVEGNDFIVNLRLAYDFDKAMETDDVSTRSTGNATAFQLARACGG